MCEDDNQTKEITISVPWGFVAGKSWGDEKNPVVLCFHGIADNAGSLNRLIKYLPNIFHYIAIDLPGHGHSSHFPPHLPITSINYILVYIILVKHFKRKKYTILGHSYGGQLAFTFAQLHPEYVEKLILLDGFVLFPISPKHYYDNLRETFERFLKMEETFKSRQPPKYIYDQAVDRIRDGRKHDSLSLAAARATAERSVASVGDGMFRFTMDQRLKFFLNPTGDVKFLIRCFESYPVRCPVMIIFALDFKEQQVLLRYMIRFLEKLENVTINYIDDGHDVHNNHPEKVAPHIIDFLLRQGGKL